MTQMELFGGEDSPLRENPQFRRCMEEYKLIEYQIDKLQGNRGYLSYDQTLELMKLKKLSEANKSLQR